MHTSRFLKVSAAASALALSAAGASAATLDLTADSPANAGTLAGVGYTISAVGGALDNAQSYDGGQPTPTGDLADELAFERDGYGVDGDEITLADPAEAIVIAFDSVVRLTGVAFLDLFNDEYTDLASQRTTHVRNDAGDLFEVSDEFAELLVDGVSAFYVDSVDNLGAGAGYAEATGLSFVGQTFTFQVGTASTQNDGSGAPDFALAGIQVAAVPVPAAGLLLLGALGGLGAAARRRRRG